ncbi:KilA-N domain-containing protein [Salmonella enterica]|uniref:KilA-N domain-containing protein n=1 Tax=Salmonella enterica TaxID=28901 RepID=UPI0009B17DA5|nr:KilA-N domain-containing protein [Salmonella enterica]EAV6171060.1 KilA-N domain-containing protein [Salmonella enterica subsp. enterica serovar Havana]
MLLYLYNQTTDLIDKYSSANILAVETKEGGNGGGTWAIEPLVYAYASYLSNEFYKAIIVNKEVVDIRLDGEGRINMNDIHRAHGGAEKLKPTKYLRTKKAKVLAENLTGQICPVSVTGKGRGAETWAHTDILLAYAAWIDADFYVTVAKTFGNVARGDVEAAEQETIVASCSSIRFRK